MPRSVNGQTNLTERNMKKLFVSAGLVALGAATLDSAMADGGVTSPNFWSVGATLRGFYDDNYNIANNGKGSFGLELTPTISFHEPFKQTDVGIRYTYGLYYYEDRQEIGVNPFDQSHQVDLWVDHAFDERWHTKITDTFAVGQEPELLTPNPLTGVAVPLRINGDNISNHGGIVLNTQWSRLFSTTLTYDNSLYDYDSGGATVNSSGALVLGNGNAGPSLAGVLDRIEQNVALDLNWNAQPETTFLIGYQFSWTDYDGNEPIAVYNAPSGQPFIYHSADRDTYSHYGYAGMVHEFTPNLSGTIRVGASYTSAYADPLFPSTSWSPYADISMSYTYTAGSYFQFGFTHDVASTDQVAPDAGGHITQYAEDSVIYLDINHRITPKLTATAIGRVQYSTFTGGSAGANDETDYGVGLNFSYALNAHFSLDGGYNFDDIVTQISGYAYTRNRVYLGVSASY
jgi:hypothetical protein